MKRAFLKSLGGGAAVLLASRRLMAATPSGPDRRALRVTPFQFGARGDGVHDDTSAIIRAARAADRYGGWLVFPKGNFLVTDQVSLSGAIAGVWGEAGSSVTLRNGIGRAGFIIRELTGVDPVKKPFLFANMKIQCQVTFAGQAAVIYGIDIEGVHLVNNQILNVQVGRGIYLRGTHNKLVNGRPIAVASNVLKDNVVEIRPLPKTDCFGIEIEAERLYQTSERNAKDLWLKHFVLPQVPVPATSNVLEGNRVTGGYYGISFLGVTRTLVSSNICEGQMRSMSIQHMSNANLFLGNECIDSVSASIHFAYGASYNVITENRIRTNRARGEGLMQAYVNASNNDFFLNDVEVGPEGLPKYHCYTGVVANKNSFWGNTLSGPCGRAYISVESAFNSASNRKSARGFGMQGADDNFTDRGMYGVRVIGNIVRATSPVPVFVLAQESDQNGAYPLLMSELAGNQVEWTGKGPLLEMIESSPGMLRDVVFDGNQFSPVPRAKQLVLPRGGKHFVSRINRQYAPERPDI
ncbi:MAG: right-handed parallel beta-helix repeat-containing protein [Lautropia sp.]|nr:right-handed parallel beta-helix repeat-containing protein [Lautropia sp.]